MTGRECGTCTLCCKVFNIPELQKPAGVWCPNCIMGKGCGIYAERPAPCVKFICLWLRDEKWGADWKPEKAKFVMVAEPSRNRLSLYVDPAMPDAWKRPPYFEKIKSLMRAAVPHSGMILVVVKDNFSLFLPDGLHDLGKLAPDDTVSVTVEKKPGGDRYNAIVKKAAPEGPRP